MNVKLAGLTAFPVLKATRFATSRRTFREFLSYQPGLSTVKAETASRSTLTMSGVAASGFFVAVTWIFTFDRPVGLLPSKGRIYCQMQGSVDGQKTIPLDRQPEDR
jgi:hypothetical protein